MFTKKHFWFIGCTIVVLIMCIIFRVSLSKSRSSSSLITTVPVIRKAFEVKVSGIGTLDAAQSHTVCSEVKSNRGKIVFLIPEGTKVNKEDILVKLDQTPFEESVAQLTSEVNKCESLVSAWQQAFEWEKNQAKKEIAEAEHEIKVAELDLLTLEKGTGPTELAKLESAMCKAEQEWKECQGYLEELRMLREKGYVSVSEISQAERKVSVAKKDYELLQLQYDSFKDYILPAKLETARMRVESAKNKLEQTKKSVAIKIAQAQVSLKQAEDDLSSAKKSLEGAQSELVKTVISAPIPGLVVFREEFRAGQRRKPRVGDTVWQNQPVLFLPDVSKMVVKTRVREVDVHKIDKGKTTTVELDAFPGKVLKGKVDFIGILAQRKSWETRGEKYFDVVVRLIDSNPRLRPGMTARVEILADQVKDALTVPVNAIFESQGKKVCYVDISRSYEVRKVIIGRQNENVVEVLSGLREGERVALVCPEDVVE